MNRWLALLLAIVGGGAAAFAVVAAGTVTLYGLLWIYVLGDEPWPRTLEQGLNVAVPLIGLILWAVFVLLIWKRLTARVKAG